jgi:hypothetical protein
MPIKKIIIKRPHIFKSLQNRLSGFNFLIFLELKKQSQLKNITDKRGLIGIYYDGILK